MTVEWGCPTLPRYYTTAQEDRRQKTYLLQAMPEDTHKVRSRYLQCLYKRRESKKTKQKTKNKSAQEILLFQLALQTRPSESAHKIKPVAEEIFDIEELICRVPSEGIKGGSSSSIRTNAHQKKGFKLLVHSQDPSEP